MSGNIYAKRVQGVTGGDPFSSSLVSPTGQAIYPPGSSQWATQVLTAQVLTADYTSLIQNNPGGKGVVVFAQCSAISGTNPTWQLQLSYCDQNNNALFTAITGNVQTTATINFMTWHPDVPVLANFIYQAPLPPYWKFKILIGGTTPSITMNLWTWYTL